MYIKMASAIMLVAAIIAWQTNQSTADQTTATATGDGATAVEAAIKSLDELPPSLGGGFRCTAMVKAVNDLRRIGRDKAVETLTKYTESKEFHQIEYFRQVNAIIICRLLFEAPAKGWTIPELGGEVPNVDRGKAAAAFPIFPTVSCDGNPFMLVNSYFVFGAEEPASVSIQKCKELTIIPTDLPTSGFDAAAKKLISSGAIERVYSSPENAKLVAVSILKQAQGGDQK